MEEGGKKTERGYSLKGSHWYLRGVLGVRLRRIKLKCERKDKENIKSNGLNHK